MKFPVHDAQLPSGKKAAAMLAHVREKEIESPGDKVDVIPASFSRDAIWAKMEATWTAERDATQTQIDAIFAKKERDLLGDWAGLMSTVNTVDAVETVDTNTETAPTMAQ